MEKLKKAKKAFDAVETRPQAGVPAATEVPQADSSFLGAELRKWLEMEWVGGGWVKADQWKNEAEVWKRDASWWKKGYWRWAEAAGDARAEAWRAERERQDLEEEMQEMRWAAEAQGAERGRAEGWEQDTRRDGRLVGWSGRRWRGWASKN